MLFYGFVLLLGLGIATWLIRSPVTRQLRRGHGFDSSGRFGNRLFDHAAERGLNRTTWNDDNSQGKRESSRVFNDPKQVKPKKWD
jgi:hypothetical protein